MKFGAWDLVLYQTMPDYPKEQLWELYKSLPEDLQKAIFSQEVADNIQKICLENGVKNDDAIFNISKNIGYVFLGLLAPDEFESVLEKELKIEKDKAKKISSQISRFVFLPVKKSLEALYKIEIKPELKETEKEENKEKPKRKDKYREVVE